MKRWNTGSHSSQIEGVGNKAPGKELLTKDDDFRDTSVQSLGRFVGSLLQLSIVRRLLYDI
jgi:hypothetical protein